MHEFAAGLDDHLWSADDQGGAVRRLQAARQRGDWRDVVSLGRHVLRRQELREERPTPLALGAAEDWPSPAQWELGGVSTVVTPDDTLVLQRTAAWQPTFRLQGDASYLDLAVAAPGGMAVAGQRVPTLSRRFEAVSLDPPLFGIEGLASYRGAAQQEAVRAAMRCPPGGVLHVLLPTGTGKSLVGLARGLAERRGTTVVVVPTVALAQDQERKARSSPLGQRRSLPRHLAYFGDLDATTKAEIRQRVATGTQGLLFASPEALVQGRLSEAVHRLAATGGLASLIIDEAHLVATWGNSFRPAFQVLPALRQGLLALAREEGHAGFATVTMTGTLTEAGLASLLKLFSGDPVELVGSTFVRSEPRYVRADFPTTEERDTALIEFLTHAPRPAVVYVSRPSRARDLVQRLRTAGFARTEAFTGETSGSERRRILEGWTGERAEPSLDIVVGTSAFGLGIDVSNVRTVVHACLPETFDRFYQEVGRGGRDWHASVSILLTAPSDVSESESLRSEKVITAAVGWPRWERMREGSSPGSSGWFDVDVRRRVDGATPEPLDVSWNVHVLSAMQQARLIDLRTRVAPRATARIASDASEDDETLLPPSPVGLEARWLVGHVGSTEAWSAAIADHRGAVYDAVEVASGFVSQLWLARRCVNLLAAEAYSIDHVVGHRRIRIRPAGACRGCFVCGRTPSAEVVRSGSQVRPFDGFTAHLPTIFDVARIGTPYTFVVEDNDRERRNFVAALVKMGMSRVAGAPSWPAAFWEHALRASPTGWVVLDDLTEALHPLPSVILLDAELPDALLRPDGGPRICVLRRDTRRRGDRSPLVRLYEHYRPSDFLSQIASSEVATCRS